MSTTITTMPTLGERAIITEYGHRTPATWVEECATVSHRGLHWCYDGPTIAGGMWATQGAVEREPIPAEPEPREWQHGDVVDHPKWGRGLVYASSFGALRVTWGFLDYLVTDNPDELTLVLAAPEPPLAEPTGLGAVVRDRDGELWVQVDARDSRPWRRVSYPSPRCQWAAIDAVEDLSEGHTPKEDLP